LHVSLMDSSVNDPLDDFAYPDVPKKPERTGGNKDLLAFFLRHFRPGRIGLVGTDDFIGEAIREAQRTLTLDGRDSKWSHAFLMGERRVDGNFYIFESDLEPDFERPQVKNGAQESPLAKWTVEEVKYAAVLDMGIEDDAIPALLSTALTFVHEREIAYSISQLVGTWLQIIRAQIWRPNPFEDMKALYCSSFVRYCYQSIGRDIVGQDIHLSNTAPEHLWQSSSIVDRQRWTAE